MEHFSVLMSVYIREQAALLDRALQSILVNQSVKPSELVLVEDGPLTDGLYHVIDKYFPNSYPLNCRKTEGWAML